jgi:hypothetical protein
MVYFFYGDGVSGGSFKIFVGFNRFEFGFIFLMADLGLPLLDADTDLPLFSFDFDFYFFLSPGSFPTVYSGLSGLSLCSIILFYFLDFFSV